MMQITLPPLKKTKGRKPGGEGFLFDASKGVSPILPLGHLMPHVSRIQQDKYLFNFVIR